MKTVCALTIQRNIWLTIQTLAGILRFSKETNQTSNFARSFSNSIARINSLFRIDSNQVYTDPNVVGGTIKSPTNHKTTGYYFSR